MGKGASGNTVKKFNAKLLSENDSKLRIWLHLLEKSLMENLRWKTCDGKRGKPGNSARKVLTNSLKVEVTII